MLNAVNNIERYSLSTRQDEGTLFFDMMQTMYVAMIDAISTMNLHVQYTDPEWKELQTSVQRVSKLLDLDIAVQVDMDTSKDEELARNLASVNMGGRPKAPRKKKTNTN
jgi:hypothetical protein